MFLGTWDIDSFRRSWVSVMGNSGSDANGEFGVLGHIISSIDATVSIVFSVGGSNFLREIYSTFNENVIQRKLLDFLIFTLRLLKCCLRKSSSVLFESLDALSMT